METEQLYNIIRLDSENPSQILKEDVTLEEAQEHCQRDDSHGDGWFDGYRKVED